ncbi:MAG: HAD family phosphatase [Clostridia bacterium]|nr:HAD family phosphatase [Clostridia bacterium]
MIKNIVFDMGGVLLEFDVRKAVGRFFDTPEEAARYASSVMGSFEWREFDRGCFTRRKMVDAINARLPEKYRGILEELCIKQIYAEKEMPQYEEMYDLVRELSEKGYRLLLLSNAGYDFEFYSKKKSVLNYIPERFVSCYYHLLKPEPEMYRRFFREYSLEPGECVFIDDVEENVRGSIACGMPAIRFSPGFAPVSQLRRELAEMGVDISLQEA